jgi:hypothetical protein
MEKELFFVGISEPVEVRKELLGCSKDVITTLKRFERFKQLRSEKSETVAQLKKQFDELYAMSNKLKQLLPKTKLRAIGKLEFGAHEPSRKEPANSLDRLEQQLTELEGKLGQLK